LQTAVINEDDLGGWPTAGASTSRMDLADRQATAKNRCVRRKPERLHEMLRREPQALQVGSRFKGKSTRNVQIGSDIFC